MTGGIQRPPLQPLVPPGGHDLLTRDMTAVFSADCTLRFAQEKLASVNQWLPIDGDPDATLGALIDTNSTGPLRLGFGGWRDLLLGMQFTSGSGELITAGGRTVKNVAGYDLTKFMIGGHGIFGRVVTLTTRTYRKPDGALLARHAPDPAILASMLATPLRPQWALLTRHELLCGYLSDETTLAWYESHVRSSNAIDVTRCSLQEDIDRRAQLWRAQRGADGGVFRASVPPAKLRPFVDSLGPGGWVADAAFGIVLGSLQSADDASRASLRAAADAVGGRVRFGTTAQDLEVSTNPGERQIIERLKSAFDPDNKLNPLPWQTR